MRSRRQNLLPAIVFVLASAAASPLSLAAVEQAPRREGNSGACTLKPGPKRTAIRVADGETLVLDDGSEVRLIGSLSPRASDANAKPGSWPAEQRTIEVLSELVVGQTVELAYGAKSRDRYGRHLSHVFIGQGDNRIWVQGRLLSLGLTRAYAIPGDAGCLAELLAHEKVARLRHAGVWRNRFYRIRQAGQDGWLMSLRSSFQVIKGRVASISKTKSGLYINFGSNWREDFTVKVPPALYSRNPSAADRITQLEGREIEVRGWIERNNGPMIVISDLAEIGIRDLGALDSQGDADAAPETPNGPDTSAIPEPELPEPSTEPSKEERPEPGAPGALDL